MDIQRIDMHQFDDYGEADSLWSNEEQKGLGSNEIELLNTLRWDLVRYAREIDKHVAQPLPQQPSLTTERERQVARAGLSSWTLVAALTVGQVQQQFQTIAAQGRGLLQRALQWFLNHLFKVLNAVAAHLTIDSWSVEASGGFPWGVNLGITVTFK